ncbi:MAG: MucB/RseB C-terminal domain-containing protein [Ideonella sp.]
MYIGKAMPRGFSESGAHSSCQSCWLWIRRCLVNSVGLLLCAGACAAPPAAESGLAAAAPNLSLPAAASVAEAQRWFTRIQQAPAKQSFQGTFIVTSGGAMSSARMTHYRAGKSQYELIESLNGQARQVYRHDEVIQTMWPQQRVALVEKRGKLGSFPALLEGGSSRLLEFYELRVVGVERIAGRIADVLSVTPRDDLRFAIRLWSDKDTGLLLREDVIDGGGQLLESSSFSDVVIGVTAQPESFLAAMKKLDGYRVVRPTFMATELESEGWAQREVVPGFRRVSCIKRPLFNAGEADSTPAVEVLQTIFTDGLTYVSVFIEPYNAERHSRPVLTSIGATHTLMIRHSDWWITVVGDVPATTLRAFASAMERKR